MTAGPRWIGSLLLVAPATLLGLLPRGAPAADITQEEVRSIAREAYIYGFPMVDNYRIQYAYFVDTKDPEVLQIADAIDAMP
jgi:hypothetical protein